MTLAPNTDPMESVQLNLKPICIFKYGNQLYNYITHRAVVLYNCDPYKIRWIILPLGHNGDYKVGKT